MANHIAKLGLEGMDDAHAVREKIENAHWLSSRLNDRPRQAIVRFHSRVVRSSVLRSARAVPNSKIRMFEDLTKIDYAAKFEAKDEMKELWNKGYYVRFINGKIIKGGLRDQHTTTN